MNTYSCWYQGRFGYCFEHPRSGWWFIPATGDQPVARHLALADLTFTDPAAYRMEHDRCLSSRPRWQRWLRHLLLPVRTPGVSALLLPPALH